MKMMVCIISGLTLGLMASAQKFPEAAISNGVVKAKLYLPDEVKGYYQGVRFDRSGNMPVLEWKGHSFSGQWFPKYDPKLHDAIMGPVEDFAPVDFRDKKAGEKFLKIGVGMLVKPDDKVYTIRRLYDNLNPGKWSVNKEPNHVLFIHELNDSEYSYYYEKDVVLPGKENVLILSHTLRNTGKKTIETTVYDHNFFMIDNEPAGPGIEIVFPYEVSGEGMGIGADKLAVIGGKKITFLRKLATEDTVYCSDIKGYGADSKDYDIHIRNLVTRTGIHITCDQPLARLPFWSCSTTACPEPYIKIKVGPGETMTWKIKYEFYNF